MLTFQVLECLRSGRTIQINHVKVIQIQSVIETIWLTHQGLSLLFFMLSMLGNLTYGASVREGLRQHVVYTY